MKKKVLSVLLVAAMATSMLAGCGSSDDTDDPASNAGSTESSDADADSGDDGEETVVDYGSGEIKIWVAEEVVDLTQSLADQFIADKGVDYTVTVEACGEGDAATNMITDVEAGADIYGFAQDQLSRLVAAGAIQQLNDSSAEWVQSSNDDGAVAAATVGDAVYAFPMTSDNGYFLYYDSSVITDPSSLEQILADCEAAGVNFYFDADSAWYNAAFFFATGAECSFDTDSDGNFISYTATYASDAGLVAYKALISMIESSAFVDGSSVSDATNIGAIVDGTWDSSAAKEVLGDNYACAKLPSFTGSDGNTYQLSGFGGFKLLGVKPQSEGGKLALCLELAQYLTDTDAQLARYESNGWGPSNLTAQADEAVQADAALSAVAEQLAYTIPQGQYPTEWWDLANALGADVESGMLSSSSSDDELMAELQLHDDSCASYVTQ